MAMAESYQFKAQPRPVEPRAAYRDDTAPLNIMQDRRVVRGNTYAALVLPQQKEAAEIQQQRDAQRRRLLRANQTRKRAGTPEPVMGRKHSDVQTDSYLEELTERTVEFEAETQTDFLLDRPQSPLFLPAKVGVDCHTQVVHGDLFDFDREVEPVLEVLVGKTLEHGMMEVLEEEELASIRRRQALFEQTRHAELLDVQRMEAAEKRREDEKMRRFAQEKARAEEEYAAFKKAHSRATARNYLSGLGRKCLNLLEGEGLFNDKVQVAVETDFLPWLINSVVTGIDGVRERQAIMDETVTSVLAARAKPHQVAIEKEKKRRDLLEFAEKQYRKTLDEELALRAKKKEREAAEAKRMVEWDEFIDPVAIPEGTPFKFGGLEEGGLVKLVTDGSEEEPQTMGLGGPEPDALQAKIEAAVKEQTEVGGVVMVYVTGE